MPWKNKETKKAYFQRPYVREKTKIRVKRWKEDLIEWFKKYKETLQCSVCGETHPACLDFHHRDPSTKKAPVGNMVHRSSSKTSILREIEKCDVLCANCHRKLHWK